MLIANHVIGTYGFQEMIVTTFRLKTFVLTLIFTIIMAIPPALSQEHSKHGGHGAHSHGKGITLPEGPEAPSVSINITKDKVGGWNLHAQTQTSDLHPNMPVENILQAKATPTSMSTARKSLVYIALGFILENSLLKGLKFG